MDEADALCEGLLQMQPSLHQRARQGEDMDVLAEETWELFCSVR